MSHEQVQHTVEWEGHYEQFGQKHPVAFQDMYMTGDGNIHGGGSDPVGTFHINGHIDGDGLVTFKKAYQGAHTVNYKGQLVDGKIAGSWEVSGSTGGFEISMKTKQWKGVHSALGGGALSGPTNKLIVSLDFSPKSVAVKGIGSDDHGNFTVVGTAPPEFGKQVITFEKRYFKDPKRKVYHAGVIVKKDGKEFIVGNWHIPGEDAGEFRIEKQQ